MAIEVKDSDLYQNGRIIQLDGDEQLLLRNTLVPKQELTDKYIEPSTDDELTLLAYFAYKDIVPNANQYWWLLSDRNNGFNPLENTVVDMDGVQVSIVGQQIVLPNLLKQQPEFSA